MHLSKRHSYSEMKCIISDILDNKIVDFMTINENAFKSFIIRCQELLLNIY